MAKFLRKVFPKRSSPGTGGGASNVLLHADCNEPSQVDKSELEESIASVSGNRADAESSDFERQPKQPKKKKRSQHRSKSVGSRPSGSVASESSGPETAEQENQFRVRSKSADVSVSTSTAIKPFQKNVGSSEADNLTDKTVRK